MKVTQKDAWDKFDIVFKSIVLGIIPIVIGLSANNIAQSLKRGELVQSLIGDLTELNTKRDVALIALDAAIPESEICEMPRFWYCQHDPNEDQVIDIAMVLINSSINNDLEHNLPPEELQIAKKIIEKRSSPSFYHDHLGESLGVLLTKDRHQAFSNVNNSVLQPNVPTAQEVISQTIAAIQPTTTQPTDGDLAGIRLVYIQYDSNRELAATLQSALQRKGISAPGIERVRGISQNNIRYANPTDLQAAEKLQAYLAKEQNIQVEKLVDLSRSNYRVASGQFEIWLK